MLDARSTASLALVLAFATAPAAASAQSPRAARVLTLLSGDSPGVLVARDRVFVPDTSLRVLSACAGARCAPVASATQCSVPQCPGSGALFVLDAPIGDVSDLPTDRDGFEREVGALRADPSLSAIAWSFGTHPDPPPSPPEPARWVTSARRDVVSWELGAGAFGGVLAPVGIAGLGGEVSGGFRFTWETHGEDDEIVAIMFGNVIGLDLRVRALALVPLQGPEEWALTIGLAPGMGIAPGGEPFRLPAVYSLFVPEVGVALRTNRDAIWYAGWSLPLTILVDGHVGIDARASVLLMDDWAAGDDVEAFFGLGVGLVLR